jgi:DNA polymerase alpha subunit B
MDVPVMATLDKVLDEHADLQIVLVPSLRDAHHQYVYPQPPFNKKKACEALGTPEHAKRVHMMPNPCTFSVNEVVFGISTLDIVMHLSSNELHR